MPSGLQIGVIGLATIETLVTTNAFKTNLVPHYQFDLYTDIIIEESAKLRK